MQDSGFAAPILVRNDGTSKTLAQVPIAVRGVHKYDEAWLQQLLFRHPEALPIAEIDDSFTGLVPLCMEMSTPVGPIDGVFVTPSGRLALLETKLWRNPQARREVVGQILDYAKELTNWDYSRLDSQVVQARKAANEQFPGVAEWVARAHPQLVQHRFQDAVTKSLGKGDFLLLVAGDGIREGVGAIAQYLDRNGALHFTFGLIECTIYENPDGGFLLQPRVLAQTTKLIRTVLVQADGTLLEQDAECREETSDEELRPDLIESREKYQKFWQEFLSTLRLEASQPMPTPGKARLQNFAMPKGSRALVTALLWQTGQKAFVYLRFARGTTGEQIYEALRRDRQTIDGALGLAVEWRTRTGEPSSILVEKYFPGNLLEESRTDVQKWLSDCTERFVSVFRPRIEHLLREGLVVEASELRNA